MEEYKWFESLDEISQHNTEDSCHITYDKMVFDVTESLDDLGEVVTVEDCGKEVFFTEEEWYETYDAIIEGYLGEILGFEEEQLIDVPVESIKGKEETEEITHVIPSPLVDSDLASNRQEISILALGGFIILLLVTVLFFTFRKKA